MYKYILEATENLDWLALFALLTFFIIFSLSIYLAFVSKKSEMSKMARLPLDDDDHNLN